MTVAEAKMWGTTIGAVSWDDDRGYAAFEYAPTFLPSGREVAPLTMPLAEEIYSFPALARETFHGLPGLLADSLPDRFGNALIDAWLAAQGRSPGDFNPVERLCYVGERGMGTLEFAPPPAPIIDSPQLTWRHSSSWPVRYSRAEGNSAAPSRLPGGNRRCRVSSGSAPRPAAPAPRRSSPGIRLPTRCAPGRFPPMTDSPTGY